MTFGLSHNVRKEPATQSGGGHRRAACAHGWENLACLRKRREVGGLELSEQGWGKTDKLGAMGKPWKAW